MPADRARRRSTRLASKPASTHDSPRSFSEDDDYSGSEHLDMSYLDNSYHDLSYQDPSSHERVFDAPSTEPIQLSKRVQNAKLRKGSGYIPRAQNCFMIFRNAMIRSKVLPTGDMNNATISKVISNTWAAMPESEKNEWREKARQAKFEHSLQYPDYRYRPKHKPRKNKNKTKKAEAEEVAVETQPTQPQTKTRAPRTKKIPTTRAAARDADQSSFVTHLILQGIKGEEARERIRLWTNDWEAQHPHSEFPDDPIFDGQEATLALPPSRPQSASAHENNALPPYEEGRYAAEEPASSILAPVPSTATQATFMDYGMGHRRSMSQPPNDLFSASFPGFYHEDPVQPVYPSAETRSWLGHRRSSSVGALQYAALPANGRRPSTANVLYPQAFQGGNPFFPTLPPSFAPQDQLVNAVPDHQEPVFDPSFTFSGSGKPALPALSLPPDVLPFNQLSLSTPGSWNPYSAGPASSVSGPPSTIYTGSQAPSPEPLMNMPPPYEAVTGDVWTHPIPVESMITDAPQEELPNMEEYLHFTQNSHAGTEHLVVEHPVLVPGNEIYHS